MQDDGEIESENSGRYSLWRHRGHMGVFSILMLLVLQYCNSQQEKRINQVRIIKYDYFCFVSDFICNNYML